MSGENDIRAEFEHVDRDDNGVIDLEEFSELLRSLHLFRIEDVVRHAFKRIDKNNNGVIDFEEFAVWWSTLDERPE